LPEVDHDQQLQLAADNLLALGGAECRSHDSSIDGQRFHYLESGIGPPLLLLHGAGGGGANWYRVIGPLSSRWRVIVPDLPGFGFSDPIEPRAPLGHQVAQLLARWLSSIGVRRAHVIGTSFGGLVALRLPQYFDISRILVTDSVGLSRRLPPLLRLATLPLVARMVVSPTRKGTRAMLRHALTATHLEPVHEQGLVNYLYASARRSDARTMTRAFIRFAGLHGQRDVLSHDELRAIADRLLIVWGARDRFLPVSDVKRAAALAGCAEVRMIPRAGHSPNWENPDALLDIISEFLGHE
jgi:pimeloyl-ACP methyl ester carboxylesterase